MKDNQNVKQAVLKMLHDDGGETGELGALARSLDADSVCCLLLEISVNPHELEYFASTNRLRLSAEKYVELYNYLRSQAKVIRSRKSSAQLSALEAAGFIHVYLCGDAEGLPAFLTSKVEFKTRGGKDLGIGRSVASKSSFDDILSEFSREGTSRRELRPE